jgi:rhodanese-related sulfurtransferase
MGIQTITPTQLHQLIQARRRAIDLIDVRTPAEYREVHAELARLVPLDSLDPGTVMKERAGSGDEPLYVICRSGARSRKACEAFLEAGYTNVVNVEGGTSAWEGAGLPVVRGQSTMPLSYQVWVAAGLLILLGTYLGSSVHPSFYALSATAGAALFITGLRDDNSLEILMARLPWNRQTTGGAGSTS